MTFFNFLTLCVGLAFFLFGMQTMSRSLERLAGGKLEVSLKKMTSSPVISCVLGAVITIAMQSSSACSVMLVGLVNSGIMQFSQTINVLFGANVGTTLTAWILSLTGISSSSFFLQMLKPVNFSAILAVIGVFMNMLAKSERKKSIGNILVGFAVLMYGMDFMSSAVSPLAELPEFGEILVRFTNPVLGLVVGTLFTALIQSSAASIGILQALSMTGSITYGVAIPIIMGQNIGTCITGIMSCIGTNVNAKRVAVLHTSIKTLSALILLPVYLIANEFLQFSFHNMSVDPVGIALIHTLFNLIATAILMPNSKLLIKLVKWMTKGQEEPAVKEKQVCVLDERLLRSPSVAVQECANYTVEMCSITRDTLLKSMTLFDTYDEKLAATVVDLEDTVDLFEDHLGTFLVKLSGQHLSEKAGHSVSVMLHTIGDFERMSDHAVNIKDVAQELHEKKLSFSAEAKRELNALTGAINEILSLTEQAFINSDLDAASKVEPLEQVVDKLIVKIKDHHIARLQRGECTIEMGFILNDLLNNYSRVSDHCSNVAVAVIEVEHDSFDTHKYLADVRYGSEEFARTFDQFSKKYAL